MSAATTVFGPIQIFNFSLTPVYGRPGLLPLGDVKAAILY